MMLMCVPKCTCSEVNASDYRCYFVSLSFFRGLGIPQQAKIGLVSGLHNHQPNRLRSVIADAPACCYYAEFGIMNSELSKLTIKKDVQKNVSVSFDNCIESNRGCLWGNQMSPVTHKTKNKS